MGEKNLKEKNKNELNVSASCSFIQFSFSFFISNCYSSFISTRHLSTSSFFPSSFLRKKNCFFAAFYELQDFSCASHYSATEANSFRVSILGINRLRGG